MPNSVDVSVIVPAYQAESFLAGTLATVARQTRHPLELIVVDDGSTDTTCAVAESFAMAHPELSVRMLREPHRGPGAARNAGVRAARADWIAFLDSDDLWHPQKLEWIISAIQAHPAANFYCHNEIKRAVDGTESVTDYGAGFVASKPVPRQLYQRNYFSTSAVVCRRDLVLRWGGFDESLSSAQDYELWLRMSPDLIPIFVREALGTYVLREGNITTSRFWGRLWNMLRVKHRHRTKVEAVLYGYSIARLSLSHFVAPFRAHIRAFLNRLT
jgi:glycosyltransferase involved in cell wall biosynthesis